MMIQGSKVRKGINVTVYGKMIFTPRMVISINIDPGVRQSRGKWESYI